ncbi:hypothetical protein [Sellimonas intestinalis]|uniref:hypothetical protein n=1 Tax=Sellimonas intestinalis TaxID=1653434 RepID=UPI00399BDD18
MLEQIGEIEEMGIHEIRLHFTIEDTEETKKGDPDLRRCILEGTENSYGSRGIC